jgi:hypothetical protein
LSSSAPGASPMNMMRALSGPSPGTAMVLDRARSQRGQTKISLASSVRRQAASQFSYITNYVGSGG